MQWLMDNYVLLITVLFAISEALALIPQVKANSVFTMILDILAKAKAIVGMKK